MKIIELPSFFPPYGGEFCHDQAKALQALDHDVTIISVVQLSIRLSRMKFLTYPWNERRYQMDGVEVWQLFTHGIPKVIRPNVQHWIDKCVQMVENYISERGKPDVIHAHCGKWAGCAARIINQRHGVPYVITEHMAMYDVQKELDLTGGANSWEIPLLKDAYHNARLLMPVSRQLITQMQPVFGTDYQWKEQPNMIDTDFYAFRPRRQVTDEPLRLLCLAHYSHRKGYDLLFDALNKIEGKEHFEVHAAGRNTDSPDFRQLMDSHGVSEVTCHGLLDKHEVLKLLYHCDALVLPTRGEVHPLVVLEAISSGMPAVITEACPTHTLPPDSYIPVSLNTIDEGLLKVRTFLKTYDAKAASQHIANNLSTQAVARSIERNIMEHL